MGSDKSQFASLVLTAANNWWIKSVRPKVRLVLVLDDGVLEIPHGEVWDSIEQLATKV